MRLETGDRVLYRHHLEYGEGTVVGEWGSFKDKLTGADVSGQGVFYVRFEHDIMSINQRWLKKVGPSKKPKKKRRKVRPGGVKRNYEAEWEELQNRA